MMSREGNQRTEQLVCQGVRKNVPFDFQVQHRSTLRFPLDNVSTLCHFGARELWYER